MPVKPPPYDIGDDLQLDFAFLDANDDPADPGTITGTLLCPDGISIPFTDAGMTNPSTGVWRLLYTVANSWGYYHVTAQGDPGNRNIVLRATFAVRRPADA